MTASLKPLDHGTAGTRDTRRIAADLAELRDGCDALAAECQTRINALDSGRSTLEAMVTGAVIAIVFHDARRYDAIRYYAANLTLDGFGSVSAESATRIGVAIADAIRDLKGGAL